MKKFNPRKMEFKKIFLVLFVVACASCHDSAEHSSLESENSNEGIYGWTDCFFDCEKEKSAEGINFNKFLNILQKPKLSFYASIKDGNLVVKFSGNAEDSNEVPEGWSVCLFSCPTEGAVNKEGIKEFYNKLNERNETLYVTINNNEWILTPTINAEDPNGASEGWTVCLFSCSTGVAVNKVGLHIFQNALTQRNETSHVTMKDGNLIVKLTKNAERPEGWSLCFFNCPSEGAVNQEGLNEFYKTLAERDEASYLTIKDGDWHVTSENNYEGSNAAPEGWSICIFSCPTH